MKKLLPFFILALLFSVKSFAQPTGDLPGDPGGDIYTYENGYVNGANEAADLKLSLAASYNSIVLGLECHRYSESAPLHLGQVDDFNSPYLTFSIVTWQGTPNSSLFQDPSASSRISELQFYKDESPFDEGYYQGFLDHWYY